MGWKIDKLGISSRDLHAREQNPVKSNYGSKWKFAKKKDHDAMTGEKASAPKPVPELNHDEIKPLSEEDLGKLTKAQLAEIGASLGVTDLSGTRDKMINAILSKQK